MNTATIMTNATTFLKLINVKVPVEPKLIHTETKYALILKDLNSNTIAEFHASSMDELNEKLEAEIHEATWNLDYPDYKAA